VSFETWYLVGLRIWTWKVGGPKKSDDPLLGWRVGLSVWASNLSKDSFGEGKYMIEGKEIGHKKAAISPRRTHLLSRMTFVEKEVNVPPHRAD